MNNWISVKDRLPEIGQEVNVLTNKGKVTALTRFAHYEGDINYFWDNDYPGCGNRYLKKGITHWQPLPEPPKELNDD